MVDFSSLKKRLPFRRKIFYSFIVCLGMCLGLLPQNASAASVFNYDRWYSISNTNFNSGTLSFPQNTITGTGAVTIPANASLGGSNWKKTNITFIAPNTPPSTEFKNGNSFTTTFSLVTNNPYLGQAGTSRAVDITCPILDTRFNTTDCQIDSIETSFDERHYIVWNFVITGSISTTTDADRIVAQLDIVNYSDSPVTLWVLPARSAYGEGSFTVIRNILGNVQQMNSYLGGISTALTNSNNYLSTIQSLVNQILTKMDNANVSGVITQQQITNQKLDSLQQSIEEQSEQQENQYEQEKEEESEREAQIQSDADDSQISAQVTGNPFTALFSSNECVTLTTISGWFNASPAIQVCSPYPANIRPILLFVTSALMVGLLIRLYYKRLNGGYNG